ncbi:MAG: hypothetical protein AB8G77_24600 [Rhodothermales bacterium]
MVHPAIQKKILDQLGQLALEKQQQVLAFAEALGKHSIKGLPGNAYLRFAGVIDAENAASIKKAVVEGCEQVDENEW